jgi:hypothetical protein
MIGRLAGHFCICIAQIPNQGSQDRNRETDPDAFAALIADS